MAPPVPKSLGLNSSKSLNSLTWEEFKCPAGIQVAPREPGSTMAPVSGDADHRDPCGSWDSVATQWGVYFRTLASKHHLQSEPVTDMHTGVHGRGGHFLFPFSILYEAGRGDFEEKNQLHLHMTKNISQEKL